MESTQTTRAYIGKRRIMAKWLRASGGKETWILNSTRYVVVLGPWSLPTATQATLKPLWQ
jgi:hypothetical protein